MRTFICALILVIFLVIQLLARLHTDVLVVFTLFQIYLLACFDVQAFLMSVVVLCDFATLASKGAPISTHKGAFHAGTAPANEALVLAAGIHARTSVAALYGPVCAVAVFTSRVVLCTAVALRETSCLDVHVLSQLFDADVLIRDEAIALVRAATPLHHLTFLAAVVVQQNGLCALNTQRASKVGVRRRLGVCAGKPADSVLYLLSPPRVDNFGVRDHNMFDVPSILYPVLKQYSLSRQTVDGAV